jgi:DNA-binding CsgD family transcriptional regulator
MDREPAMNQASRKTCKPADMTLHSAIASADSAIALTIKEKEVLHWAAMGKSTWDISRINGCSEATVSFHKCNIRRKFGVNSLSAALIKALHQGLIVLH